MKIPGDHHFSLVSTPEAQNDFSASCMMDSLFLTAFKARQKALTYEIVCSLGMKRPLYGFRYFPLIDDPSGRIEQWKISISDDGQTWHDYAEGEFQATFHSFWPHPDEHYVPILFQKMVSTAFVKLSVLSTNDGALTISDLNWITDITDADVMACSFASFKGHRMATSVHLRYQMPPSRRFYNEMTIQKSAPESYFMACGFTGGYFGLQELKNKKKVLIFSVWDLPEEREGEALLEHLQTRCEFKIPEVRIGRFGGEGTGGQSFMDVDWKIGETYRFMVECEPLADQRIAFSAYFFDPEVGHWQKLITFSTPLQTQPYFTSYYSFVEDFKRNWRSSTLTRAARFSNAHIHEGEQWIPCTEMVFTKDINPNCNVDCLSVRKGITLKTGGDIFNKHIPLYQPFTQPLSKIEPPEID